MIVETFSADETYEFGRKLGSEAQPGDIYCLTGDLGVGKTVFTQGFAAGLGINEAVNSPTFTIVQEYEGERMPFYHFDVYRIGDVEEMDEIGFKVARYDRRGLLSIIRKGEYIDLYFFKKLCSILKLS